MGPHFFKCGKLRLRLLAIASYSRFNGAALFQVRKVGQSIIRRANPNGLQWGRTFSSAESEDETKALIAKIELQWGRTFSSAESLISLLLGSRFDSASMGPHFFKCGK